MGEGIQGVFTQDGGLMTPASQREPGFSPSQNSYVGVHSPCPKNETQPCYNCVLSCSVMSDPLWLHGLTTLHFVSVCCVCVWLVAQSCRTLCDSCQAPLSMGFSRQEYKGELPFPSPGGPSRSRDQIQVSHIVGRFFKVWVPMGLSGYM